MTHLIEQIKVLITLHRDEEPNFPFDNLLDLKNVPKRGRQRLGNVTWEWERLGVEEVPELGGSDN